MNEMPPRPGARIGGRYVLEELIGYGGMGVVYSALDEQVGRPVAVKFVHSVHFGPGDLVERLRQEASYQGGLHHENIAPVLDAGEEQGVAYIVLRLVEGGTLHGWLTAHPDASLAQRLALLRQIAAGLDYAHSKKLLHRDIKPGNVLIDPGTDGTPCAVIGDFGLALKLDQDEAERMTAPGMRLGTASYTAPELWRDGRFSPASDIYAFGCLAYQVLAGRLPFTGAPAAIMHGHLEVEPAPPSRYRPECRGAIDERIATLLDKDPARRPATAGAAFSAQALDGAVPPPITDRRRSKIIGERSRLRWLTLAHVALYAVVFAASLAAGRALGAPGAWGALAIAAVAVAVWLYARQRAARDHMPDTTSPLPGQPMLAPASGPPPTDTLAPLPPDKPPPASRGT